MRLIPGICPNCGATIEIDSNKDAAICRYCDTPFVVEKAVKLYNNTYNIHGEVINIFGGTEKDFLIRGGILEKYNGEATEVVIPANVKSIGNRVFEGLKISQVTVQNGVETIGDRAFSGCDKLQIIYLPEGLKAIGHECFSGCSMLREITIPSTVHQLGAACFRSCKNLLEITIPDSVEILPDRIFSGCINLKHVDLSNKLTNISSDAFCDCVALESIIIPKSIKYIARNIDDDYPAFRGCINLHDVKLPFDTIKTFLSNLSLDKTALQNWHMIQAFENTPWYSEQKESVHDVKIQAEKTHKCPMCGGKLNIFLRCKQCGWAM